MTMGSIRSVARSIGDDMQLASDPNRATTASAGWCWRTIGLPSRLWERLVHWLRHSPSGLVALALIIGTGAGLGAIVFRYLILWATVLFTGSQDYSSVGPAAHPRLPALGSWFVILAPVVGGLLYGPLVSVFAREARGHGVPEVMLAVAEYGGRIRPRVAIVKSLASALCIGSGGSVGREGPIVQIGSALGSTLGQLLRAPELRLRLLVACGAAGGISATFNAPIAGVLFALELILRDFEAESFGVVVLSSVAANVIGRSAFGSAAFLHLPPFEILSLWEYGLYAGLGVVAALVGVAFIRVLYGLEDLADAIWGGPEWLRPAVGGVLLGLLLLLLPQMYGVGYPVLEHGIAGRYGIGLLLLFLVGKIIATSLTMAIGGSGGVFAPSLFMGAMLGTAYGDALHVLVPHLAGPAGAYGLVGMGAVFAAAARAPMTAVIIIFELTGDYQIILPLMFSISLAASVGKFLSSDTIYTLKLRRRGIDIMRKKAPNLMAVLKVRDAMQPAPPNLPVDLPLDQAIARFTAQGHDALPATDSAGQYQGTVTMRAVEHALQDDKNPRAGELARDIAALKDSESLEDALDTLVGSDGSGAPVLAPDGRTLVGWLTHRDVLSVYQRARRSGSPGTQDT